MSNKERGEVSFKADDNTYTIRFPNKALCALEDDIGMSIQEILAMFQRISDESIVPTMSKTRMILRRGLVEHHGEMELESVSEILEKINYTEILANLFQSIIYAFPETNGSKKKEKPKSGTGDNP